MVPSCGTGWWANTSSPLHSSAQQPWSCVILSTGDQHTEGLCVEEEEEGESSTSCQTESGSQGLLGLLQ
jgi:hypothetical protein